MKDGNSPERVKEHEVTTYFIFLLLIFNTGSQYLTQFLWNRSDESCPRYPCL